MAKAKAEQQGQVTRAIEFSKGSWSELQKVHWPDRQETFRATIAVLGMIIFFGLFLGLTDMLLGFVLSPVIPGLQG